MFFLIWCRSVVKKKIKISASIICANWMCLKEDLAQLEEHGIDYLHYDVMDGFFCPDYCLGTQIISVIKENTILASDYHLMVEEPSRMFNNFKAKGGDLLTIHYEACKNLHRDIIKIKQLGFKVGVALNPATPISAIEYIIDDIDLIKVMSVNPGYAGQKLVPQTLYKIRLLDEWRRKDGLKFEISVDGNVNSENIPNMVGAGADILVAGSSGLFIKGMTLQDALLKFNEYIEEGLNCEG